MEWNNEHKVVIASLTKSEAEAFIHFLELERYRHGENILWSSKMARDFYEQEPFWSSAIKRHEQDISDIDILIQEVKGGFGI